MPGPVVSTAAAESDPPTRTFVVYPAPSLDAFQKYIVMRPKSFRYEISFGTTKLEPIEPLLSVAAPRKRMLPSVLKVTRPASGSCSSTVHVASLTTTCTCPDTPRTPDEAVSRTVAETQAWLSVCR